MRERSIMLGVRVSQEEYDRILNRMNDVGMRNITAYMIRMALNGYVIVMDLSELKEILRLLQISGKNLNQYAKKANETGSIYLEDINELRENQNQLLDLMGEMLKKLNTID